MWEEIRPKCGRYKWCREGRCDCQEQAREQEKCDDEAANSIRDTEREKP